MFLVSVWLAKMLLRESLLVSENYCCRLPNPVTQKLINSMCIWMYTQTLYMYIVGTIKNSNYESIPCVFDLIV